MFSPVMDGLNLEKVEINPRAPDLRLVIEPGLWSTKIFLGKVTKNWPREIVVILCWKLILGHIELEIQMEKK